MSPRRLLIAAIATVLCGCSANRALPVTQAIDQKFRSVRKASIHFTIKIPKRQPRRSHYISASTRSLSIKVYDATHTTVLSTAVADVAPSSPGCVPLSTGTECTVNAPAPPGHDTFDITTYDLPGAAGYTLSATIDYPFTVVAGSANSMSLTLGGLAASFAIVTSNATQATYSTSSGFSIYGAKPQQFTIVPLDAHGDTMVGAGVPTPVVDATPTSTTLSAPQPASPNVWALTSTYTAATNPTVPGNFTLSVTATPVPGSGGSVLHQSIPLKLYDPWIYVVDVSARKVFAFDELGNSKSIGPVFLNIVSAYCASFVPATNQVYVSDSGSGSYGVIRVYDAVGNTVTPTGSSPFAHISQPQQTAFDSHNGLLYVPNYGNSTITAYDAQGNQQSLPVGAFNLASFLNGPFAMAYDSNNNSIYIANYTNSTAAGFDEQGVRQTDTPKFPNLNVPSGMTFDTNNNLIYIANYGSSVTAYDEGGTQQTLNGTFSGTNGPGGIVYDPYDGLLYVTNYGAKSVTAYDEQGNQQTLGLGAFSGLTSPWGILVVP